MTFTSRYFSLVLLGITGLCFAGGDAKVKGAMGTKVGYVEMSRIICLDASMIDKGYEEWRDLFKDLESKVEPIDREIAQIEDEYKKGVADFEQLQKSGVASRERLENKAKEIDALAYKGTMRARERDMFYRQELGKRRASILPKVKKVIGEVRKAKGLNMVLDEVVIDADEDLDLTLEVLKKLNKTYSEEQKKKKEAEAAKKSETKK